MFMKIFLPFLCWWHHSAEFPCSRRLQIILDAWGHKPASHSERPPCAAETVRTHRTSTRTSKVGLWLSVGSVDQAFSGTSCKNEIGLGLGEFESQCLGLFLMFLHWLLSSGFIVVRRNGLLGEVALNGKCHIPPCFSQYVCLTVCIYKTVDWISTQQTFFSLSVPSLNPSTDTSVQPITPHRKKKTCNSDRARKVSLTTA